MLLTVGVSVSELRVCVYVYIRTYIRTYVCACRACTCVLYVYTHLYVRANQK